MRLRKVWQVSIPALTRWGDRLHKILRTSSFVIIIVLLVLIVRDANFRWGHNWAWATWAEEKTFGGKTIWEWLELLIIPFVLALGAFWLQRSERDREREKAKDQQRETALQAYIDKMTDLLLNKECPLRESAPEDEVRVVARTRTLTTLPGLDSARKRMLLKFLYEAKLIQRESPIIDLNEADLTSSLSAML